MRNAKGFTLIELLIVIAIIAILAAVLIPNLIGARKRAFDAAAMACARTIALVAESSRASATNLNYTFTEDDVKAFDPKSCEGITIRGDYPGDDKGDDKTGQAATFTLYVEHPNGSKAFKVSGDSNGVTVNQVDFGAGSSSGS